MIGLYDDYETATEQECLDDLYDTIEELNNDESVSEDLSTLKRRGIRIQEIAQRLKELRGD